MHIRNKTIVTGRVQRCNADTQNFCCFFSRNKFFHKAYFLQSVKFVIVFVQNHMNTLAAETTSAWYLVLNRKRQTLPIYISQLSSHLPRPLTMGTQQVSAGADVITPQHRSYRVPQGSPPPSLWRAVRNTSLKFARPLSEDGVAKNKRQKTDGCWHSSTGISPRPMLMGAAHDALRASNARVSLTCLYVIARRVPRPLCGQVGIARSRRGGHGALAVWLDTGQNVSVCLMLRRRPPTGLSLSRSYNGTPRGKRNAQRPALD